MSLFLEFLISYLVLVGVSLILVLVIFISLPDLRSYKDKKDKKSL